MQTNLHGRLRNTSLPAKAGLLPLFEAVVNSIHGIEEAEIPFGSAEICIEVLRKDKQETLDFDGQKKRRGPEALSDISGFRITDNGVGFTDRNMQSFHTFDSEYKVEKGCRGVGRLLWLKAFKNVKIDSVFNNQDGILKRRAFSFDAKNGVKGAEIEDVVDQSSRQTIVTLDGFEDAYRTGAAKTPGKISQSLFEHCLWYFLREGGCPKIILKDGGEKIDLDFVLTQHMRAGAVSEKILIKGEEFELQHVRLRSGVGEGHAMALCAGSRLVTEEKLVGKVDGLHTKISDDVGEFVYGCYVSSKFLDARCRPERTGFDFIKREHEALEATEVTEEDIHEAIAQRAAAYLAKEILSGKTRAAERIDRFVSKRAPRYRPILQRVPEERLNVDPDISDKDLEVYLHKIWSELESKILESGHDLMSPKTGETVEAYETRLAAYLQNVEALKQSDLANYVAHRKVILDLLELAIQKDASGKYASEDMIHNLIMPMGNDSNKVTFDECNLWLVNERLAFHNYLASDKALTSMPITGSTSTKEPDLLALHVYDNPILVSEGAKLPLASITVVEIKKPMRNDAKSGEDKDPIEQALNYLKRVRDGEIVTASGRPIQNPDSVPGYCYVLCDLTSTIRSRCMLLNLTETSDRLGYFGYNSNFKAFIEVISFDQLVNSAKERNRAFFDKLGLPAT